MAGSNDRLARAIRDAVASMEKPLLADVMKAIDAEIECLCDGGQIDLGDDFRLTEHALEWRVRQLFEKISYPIVKGRDGMEDFVITPPEGYEPKKPMVLEVKSSAKGGQISHKDLRQLDDWVFDLSGEEHARKHGLGSHLDFRAVLSQGLYSSPKHHPSPHKGVMVFNGPANVPFEMRMFSCLSEKGETFAVKRGFCIVPFGVLVEYVDRIAVDFSIKRRLWAALHSTEGMLPPPE